MDERLNAESERLRRFLLEGAGFVGVAQPPAPPSAVGTADASLQFGRALDATADASNQTIGTIGPSAETQTSYGRYENEL